MPLATSDPTRQLRWSVYVILIALSVGNLSGRILKVNSIDNARLESYRISQHLSSTRKKLVAEGLSDPVLADRLAEEKKRLQTKLRLQRPFLSANDRSRWLAVRALVEQGAFEIDAPLQDANWDTIDMVKHRGRDGQMHLYSSKPPLLTFLLAGEYWLLHKLTGMTLVEHPYLLGRVMLFSINVLPMILMFLIVASLNERFGTTDWGRIFIMAAATLGTMLGPFAVVLNNHIIAAVSASVAIYCLVRSSDDDQPCYGTYAFAGLASAFTAANELPALAFLVLVGFVLWRKSQRTWFVAFLPAAALVTGAFFITNYAAHDSLRPPYMHRSVSNPDDNWYQYTYNRNGKERESYWQQHRQGIDRGEPSRTTYSWHSILGHHGIISLTPIWLLSAWGIWLWLLRGPSLQRQLAMGVGLLTLICLYFFLGLLPQIDRNYGGMTSGFRWMFWFTPLWLLVMIPAADRLASSRWGQAMALVLLSFSVLSASYPTWNPWTHPWIYRWLEYCGWVGF
ncbi:MAG: hypothetical protein ABGX16_22585 [Pirellulales bacterium]